MPQGERLAAQSVVDPVMQPLCKVINAAVRPSAWEPCDWLSPSTGADDTLVCNDGSRCNGKDAKGGKG